VAFAVSSEGGRVVIDLGGRRSDLLLSCAQAERFAGALRLAASEAELAPPSLAKGERWACKAESFDGLVAVRFFPPSVGAPERVPLTPEAARALADAVDWKRQQAEHKLRITLAGV
jgi:hypothetical protein